jgi:hypothetical protein
MHLVNCSLNKISPHKGWSHNPEINQQVDAIGIAGLAFNKQQFISTYVFRSPFSGL